MKNNSEQQKGGGKRLAGGSPVNQGKKPAKAPKPGGKKRRVSGQQIALIAAVVLLALALLGVLAWRSLFVRPDIPQKDSTQQPGVSGSGSETGGPEEIDWGEGIRPRGGDGERKSADYWTVLIIGRDTGGGGLTDTLLLASYDVTNQKATVMSIPRDTMVNVPWDVKKINGVYNYYGGGEKGIQQLYKEISQLVGFEPDFQVVVEWDAVGEIVDAMGGVWFDVPRDMNYDDEVQDLYIHQEKGYRLLTGSDAMQVLRYRYDNGKKRGYPDGDLGRIKTQQAFLKAMVEQLLQVKNMSKIGQFIQVFQKNVETDMSFQNVLWFAQSAVMGGLKMEDVNFLTMPNTPRYAYSRSLVRETNGRQKDQSYVVPNAKQLLDLVNNELSPFTEVFTLRDLDIMSVNADGSVSSSTGYVEDKQAALPPPKPEPEPEEEEPAVDENGNPIDPETGLPIDPETGEPIVTDPAAGEGGEPGSTGNGETGGGTAVVPPVTDPGTAADPDPWRDPNETDPGTGTENSGTPEPAPEPPAVQEPPAVPETPEIPAVPETPAEDPGFAIIGAPPAE